MSVAARTIQRLAAVSIRSAPSALRSTGILSAPRIQIRLTAAFPIRATHRAYSTSSPEGTIAGGAAGKLLPPDYLDQAEKEVFEMLADKLQPTRLEVQDVSGGCGSMYAVEIASPNFKGLTMIKQHRMVQEILADKIKGWHGLQLKTKAE
ncbi:bola-like protein [Ascobolus immersus RN42]|uniref:Bola-like protein n=1 Tax=Ascobolus immersus RN42 TaxID=1160509 RepID=A0A3N4J1H8_ASCIM|nr:bola-like protein [Ascobolus immersus RN42]